MLVRRLSQNRRRRYVAIARNPLQPSRRRCQVDDKSVLAHLDNVPQVIRFPIELVEPVLRRRLRFRQQLSPGALPTFFLRPFEACKSLLGRRSGLVYLCDRRVVKNRRQLLACCRIDAGKGGIPNGFALTRDKVLTSKFHWYVALGCELRTMVRV